MRAGGCGGVASPSRGLGRLGRVPRTSMVPRLVPSCVLRWRRCGIGFLRSRGVLVVDVAGSSSFDESAEGGGGVEAACAGGVVLAAGGGAVVVGAGPGGGVGAACAGGGVDADV